MRVSIFHFPTIFLAALSSASCSAASSKRRGRGNRYVPSVSHLLKRNLQEELPSNDGYYGGHEIEGWDYHLFSHGKGSKSSSCSKGKGKSRSCAPTLSPMPSQTPSVSLAPSTRPSLSPSSVPTASQLPSTFPSGAPTVPTFEMTQDPDAGTTSQCLRDPPFESGVREGQVLAFQYNMYIVEDVGPSEAVSTIEDSLHVGLAEHFLTCNYDSGELFYILSIRSQPDDTLSEDAACNTMNDPFPPVESDCFVVTAQLSLEVFFPSYRRTLQQTQASQDVLNAAGQYLSAAMSRGNFNTDEIVQVSFQGFVEANDVNGGRDTTTFGGGGTGVAGLQGNTASVSNVTEKRAVLGGFVVGFAAIALLALIFVGGRRRKARQEAYLKHLENLSESDIDPNDSHETLGDGRVKWVKDDGNDSGSSFSILDMSGLITEHDSRKCSSSTCPVCRQRELNPTFVSPSQHLGYGDGDLQRICDALRIRNSYRSPDTVEL